MKKVLYLTNIEVPYRVRFFNELASHCDLTILYERERSANRNQAWASSVQRNFRVKYLKGLRIGNENAFSPGVLKEVFLKYDSIIVGCYNSPVQMMAILVMRLFRIPYLVNLDGEPFLEGKGLRAWLIRLFLSGAETYLIAGERSADSLRKVFPEGEIIPYFFSSLSEQELEEHRKQGEDVCRADTILVVGQYFDYKGMDVALEAARMDKTLRYKFVGMGGRTEQFRQDHEIPDNVELVPFLQKQELEKEYQNCAMLVLPSRKECWGLVINEAASFGTPIVSTWGSGAAVEFLSQDYPQYLAKSADAASLLTCITALLAEKHLQEYEKALRSKSQEYSIEKSARIHAEHLENR